MNCILLPKNAKSISDPQQVTHIKEVLKSRVGDSLTIAEIGGNIGKATITGINNNEVLLTDVVLDKLPPAKLDLTVVLALPRPKVLRRLIMDMTSLGVNKLIIAKSKTNHENDEDTMPKVLCIGAEGGWIDYEVDLLCQHGCTSVSLGQRILRTETVVNVLLGHWLKG